VPGVPIRGRASVLSFPVRAGARQMAVMAGCLAVLFVTGASALLLVPETATTSRDVPVTQAGRFSYSAQAAAGTTYPDGQVVTGDPVYTALAHELTLTYEQSLASDGDLRAEGTVHLAVALTAPDGWSTELPGGPAVPLSATPDGATATATVDLNTAVASGLLAAHQYEVGGGGGLATLTVTPVLEVDGTVDGRPLTTAEPAALRFKLEPTALRLEGDATALSPSTESSVAVEETGPRVFDLRVTTVPLDEARALVLGLALATSLVAVVASWVGSARGAGPAEEFLMRHSGRVLPVARFEPEGDVVDVVDPEAVHRVATKLDGLVLHHAGPDGDTFAVRDVGTTYRCVVPRAPVPQTAPAPARTWLRRLRVPRLRAA
jgi:hypothetical protein